MRKFTTPKKLPPKEQIQQDHDSFVEFVKTLRLRARLGKSYQSSLEEQTASKCHWKSLAGFWIAGKIKEEKDGSVSLEVREDIINYLKNLDSNINLNGINTETIN